MHPTVQKAAALQPLVASCADASEAQRHLSAEVAQAMAAAGLYRLAAPEDFFGGAAEPKVQVECIEAIAYADASAAWNLMIGMESFGLIAPGFAECKELIADPGVVMCSSTAAVGQARVVADGYEISGRWPFVSGCHNSQLFGATVQISSDEKAAEGPNYYAILTPQEWQIVDTWHSSGLCGSGSHDVVVDRVVIPANRMVLPLGGAKHDSALLNFPLGSRLAYNKLGVSWGMTRAAIEAFEQLAISKTPRFSQRGLRDRPHAHRAIAEAEIRLSAGRSWALELLQGMWEQVSAKDHITSAERALFQLACSSSVRGCIEAVNLLCEAAGTSANQKGHPLERLARDIRVVGQHVTVAAHHIDDAGRVLLGLPGQELMLAGAAKRT